MSIVEAMKKLRAHYPGKHVSVEVTVAYFPSQLNSGVQEVKFTVWDGSNHYYGVSLEQAVLQAVHGSGTVEAAQAMVTEAEQLVTKEGK